MAKEKVSLSSPWVLYYRKLQAFFEQDPEVEVKLEEQYEPAIHIYVDNAKKAEALEELLPEEMNFGNIKVPVIVIPSNNQTSKLDLLKIALEGNDAVVDIETIEGVFTNPISYIVFEKEVVQYYADDLGDLHGVNSTLYQDLAKEIFGNVSGVNFCTDTDEW